MVSLSPSSYLTGFSNPPLEKKNCENCRTQSSSKIDFLKGEGCRWLWHWLLRSVVRWVQDLFSVIWLSNLTRPWNIIRQNYTCKILYRYIDIPFSVHSMFLVRNNIRLYYSWNTMYTSFIRAYWNPGLINLRKQEISTYRLY